MLEVCATDTAAMLVLELVVTRAHPLWRPALPGEVHSYVDAALAFDRARAIEYRPSGLRPAVDATGGVDYGHIDSMTYTDAAWQVDGDWGSLRVDGPAPSLRVA